MDQSIIAPVTPVPPQKSSPKWLLIALFSFFLGITSVLAYQKYLPARTLPEGSLPSPSMSTVPTGLKTYTSDKYKISFQYSSDLTLQENIIDINRTQLIFDKEADNSFTLGFSVNYAPNQVKYLIDSEAVDTRTINNQIWQVYDLSLDIGLQLEKNQILYSLIYPPSQESEVTQILSTFKFTDTNEVVCQTGSDCPAGYFCNTFDQTCNQELPD